MANTTANKLGSKGEQTRLRILDTASQMLWKSSYHSLRIDKVVAQAKVNKASFYQYFKNKEHMAVESLEHMFIRTKAYAFEGSFQSTQHPVERLETIFNRIHQVHVELKENEEKTPGCPFLNLGNELATNNEDIRKKVQQVFTDFAHYHQRIYEDAIAQDLTQAQWPAEVIGRQIQGILNGAMASAKIRNQPDDILEALVTAKTLLGFPL